MSTPAPVAPSKTVVYKTTAEGLKLQTDIYAPSDASSKAAPVLVWFHIGGLLFGERGDGLFPQWLARDAKAKGWIIVAPDYRLKPEASIDDILSDVKDVWTFVHTKLNDELKAANLTPADLSNVFSTGASAGGYLALQGGHLFTPKPKGVVALYGYGWEDLSFFAKEQDGAGTMGGLPFKVALDQEEAIEAILKAKGPAISGKSFDSTWSPRELLLPYLTVKGRYFKEVFGHESFPDDAKHNYLWPQRSVTSSYPPTFLGHGSGDTIAPASESEHFAKVFQEKGVEHELLLVKDQEHMWDHYPGDVNDEGRAQVVAWIQKKIAA